jgi:hypothetical protein
MNKVEEAEEAIKKLNNYNFMGSQLTVQVFIRLISSLCLTQMPAFIHHFL